MEQTKKLSKYDLDEIDKETAEPCPNVIRPQLTKYFWVELNKFLKCE